METRVTLDIEVVEQHDHRLGRQKVHDPASRAFAMPRLAIDRSLWRDKAVRLYEPLPNPNQRVGCCTGVAKCSQFNAVGNRVAGVVLGMADAERVYSQNTRIDPWEGEWPPDDTGSSGLASAKTAQALGMGGEYRWIFGGADEVVQNVMQGKVISVGTWWYESMFSRQPSGLVRVMGDRAGGHQWAVRGYDKSRDLVLGRCWWGEFRDFWIMRTELDALLRDGGDAHWQTRVVTN
jgi:hypothetical protein